MVAIMNKNQIIKTIEKLKNIVAIRYDIFKEEVSYLFYLIAMVVFLTILITIFGINIIFLANSVLIEAVYSLCNNSTVSMLSVALLNLGIVYYLKVLITQYLCKFRNTLRNIFDLEYQDYE